MADPLRSLFISVGVRDNASASILRIGRNVDKLTAKYQQLAQAAFLAQRSMANADKVRGFTGMQGGGSAAASSGAVVSSKGRSSSKGGAAPGGGNRAFSRGSIGIGTGTFIGLAALGVGRGAFRQGAGLEAGSLRAQFASGQSARSLAAGTRARRGRLGGSLSSQVDLTQSIAQLGARGADIGHLAGAATKFSTLETEISGADAASGLFRLAQSTGLDHQSAERLASAIKLVGDASAAGAGTVFDFTRELQSMGVLAGFDAATIIALSGALADLQPAQREMFRGSLTRMFAKEFLDPKTIDALSKKMGVTAAHFADMRKNDPAALLTGIFQAIEAMPEGDRAEFLAGAGLKNIRDLTTLATGTAGLDKFVNGLSMARNEINGLGQTALSSQFQEFKGVMEFMSNDMKGSFEELGAVITTTLSPALKVLMGLITGIAQGFANSPALAGLLGVGAVVGGGILAKGFLRKQFGLFGGGRNAALQAQAATNAAGGMNATDALLMATMFQKPKMGKRIAGFIGSGAKGRTGKIAGALGKIGGGRFAGTMAMRGAASLGGLATGPVGIVITLLSVLEAPLRKLGDVFRGMGDRGGVAGAAAEGLSLIFNTLAWGAGLVNKAFDLIWSGIQRLGSFFGISAKADSAQGAMRSLNEKLFGTTEDVAPAATASGGTNFNVSVNVGDTNGMNAFLQTQTNAVHRLYGTAGAGA